jgi:hypothetical protein
LLSFAQVEGLDLDLLRARAARRRLDPAADLGVGRVRGEIDEAAACPRSRRAAGQPARYMFCASL